MDSSLTMVLLLTYLEVEDEVLRYGRASHRRPCPPLYSGRAGYNLETLEGEKDFLAPGSAPAVPAGLYPKWVPVRHWASSLPTSVPLPFSALPGCCAGQSREETVIPFVCSFTGPARSGTFWHAPARSRHALARALARHVGSDVGHPAYLACPMPAGHPPWRSMSVQLIGRAPG